MFRYLLLAILFNFILINSSNAHKTIKVKSPWFTGPIIASPGVTTPKGEYDIEPYLFLTSTESSVNIFSINPALLFYYGLAKRLDLQIFTPYSFNQNQNTKTWQHHFNDISFKLGFQALRSPQNYWLPNVRLIFAEIFPTGHFQNLDPSLANADITGSGAYQTGIGANLQQLFLLANNDYLKLLLNLLYYFPTSVQVHGFNAYGGAIDTQGSVTPGNSFACDLAFELSLTQHWVVAMDTLFTYQKESLFRGNPGFDPTHPITNGAPANEALSLAPALEYNFTKHLGLLVGVWLPVYSHNVNHFFSSVVALNYSSF